MGTDICKTRVQIIAKHGLIGSWSTKLGLLTTLLASTLLPLAGCFWRVCAASGKTSTGLFHAHSYARLDSSPQLRQLAELNPAAVLAGQTPRLVDQWQLAPAIWNAIRHEIDTRQERAQFILSGSASPEADPNRHSGVVESVGSGCVP